MSGVDVAEVLAESAHLVARDPSSASTNNTGTVGGWPAPPGPAAFHGLAGEFVEVVSPHSEADTAALLGQYLAAAGNLFGSAVYYPVEGDEHPARLFMAIVGATSKARKGTSMSRVRQVMVGVDREWVERISGGLSSGEGPLWAVRDQIMRTVRDRESGEFREEVEDPGVEDKRLLVVESELSRHFDVIARAGNTLSETLRRLWDGGTVSSLTKNSPVRATNPHVTVIGHISREELVRKATDTEFANGFLNRFVIVASRRRQELPFGGDLEISELARLQQTLDKCVLKVRDRAGSISWAGAARDRWAAVYGELSAEQPGLVGAVTARAEAQVARLSVCYALLDNAKLIGLDHLEAALAFWGYCARSAAWAFGDSTGDPVADTILTALREHPDKGLTRTEIRDLLGRNLPGDRIEKALVVLIVRSRARMVTEETGGRPAERWFTTKGGEPPQ